MKFKQQDCVINKRIKENLEFQLNLLINRVQLPPPQENLERVFSKAKNVYVIHSRSLNLGKNC